MEWVCPICNGLAKPDIACPVCGAAMQDGGAVFGYVGPYSPYVETEISESRYSPCEHLLFCEQCHYDMRHAWSRVCI